MLKRLLKNNRGEFSMIAVMIAGSISILTVVATAELFRFLNLAKQGHDTSFEFQELRMLASLSLMNEKSCTSQFLDASNQPLSIDPKAKGEANAVPGFNKVMMQGQDLVSNAVTSRSKNLKDVSVAVVNLKSNGSPQSYLGQIRLRAARSDSNKGLGSSRFEAFVDVQFTVDPVTNKIIGCMANPVVQAGGGGPTPTPTVTPTPTPTALGSPITMISARMNKQNYTPGFLPNSEAVTFPEAVNYCHNLKAKCEVNRLPEGCTETYDDWRLPSFEELSQFVGVKGADGKVLDNQYPDREEMIKYLHGVRKDGVIWEWYQFGSEYFIDNVSAPGGSKGSFCGWMTSATTAPDYYIKGVRTCVMQNTELKAPYAAQMDYYDLLWDKAIQMRHLWTATILDYNTSSNGGSTARATLALESGMTALTSRQSKHAVRCVR